MNRDEKYMIIALEEAKKALKRGDYPIGAVLVINDKIIAKASNSIMTRKNWVSHAELNVITKNSVKIRKATFEKGEKVELYTTLEPCLMCMGAIVQSRITRLIFACPDPEGGATRINEFLSYRYKKNWPEIKGRVLGKESFDILYPYAIERRKYFQSLIPELEKIKW